MNFPFFLARHFFRGDGNKTRQKASTPAVTVATLGVAVGLAVMILAVCVVKGFKQEVNRKLTGFASHIEVLNPLYFQSPESAPINVPTGLFEQVSKASGVQHVQRVSQKIGVLKTQSDFKSIVLKGGDERYDTTFLHTCLVAGRLPRFHGKATNNELLISQRQAKLLDLKVGDGVFAYFFEQTIKMRRFKVVGIYETNLKQFDETFAMTNLATVNQLNGWHEEQCSELEIFTSDFEESEASLGEVAKCINLHMATTKSGSMMTLSVKDDPRVAGTFAWLNLLDFNVWIILILMIAVAGFTMISGLLILILERTSTIGVLKALGAKNTSIRETFLYLASFIILRGLLLGNLLAGLLIVLQRQLGLVRLDPMSYYVDRVPIDIDWLWVIALNVSTLVITILALIIPSYMISHIQPAKSIRFE